MAAPPFQWGVEVSHTHLGLDIGHPRAPTESPSAVTHSPVVQATGHHQEQGSPWHGAGRCSGSEAAAQVHEEDEEKGDIPAWKEDSVQGLPQACSGTQAQLSGCSTMMMGFIRAPTQPGNVLES